ncbi:putative protein kinase RLK-Pelle-RLCK-VIIa-2 family [Helianthus anomalus]
MYGGFFFVRIFLYCGLVQGQNQAFFEELEMHTSYKHPNIVSLIGFCYEDDKMVLVYEHASKSRLDD